MTMKKIPLLQRCFRQLRGSSIKVLYKLSPELLAKIRFLAIKGYLPNLKKPQSFDEKLLWLMLYWRLPLKAVCGDKYTVRHYVETKGLGHILPKLIGVYERIDEINFNVLPDSFALKCTHGCGFNIICKDKRELDLEDTKTKLAEWMNVNFSEKYGEIHYAGMKPRIICEEYLGDFDAANIYDYKMYCFDGKVHCTMVCSGRDKTGHNAVYCHYDREWKNRLNYDITSIKMKGDIPKPAAYEEMISAAEILSKPFPFVRVDFYSVKGKAVLGEMTFTPAGCIDPDCTESAQLILGALIRLPK